MSKEYIANFVLAKGRTHIDRGEDFSPQAVKKEEGLRPYLYTGKINSTGSSSTNNLSLRRLKYDELMAEVKISKEPLLEYFPLAKNEHIYMVSVVDLVLFSSMILLVGLFSKFRSLNKLREGAGLHKLS